MKKLDKRALCLLCAGLIALLSLAGCSKDEADTAPVDPSVKVAPGGSGPSSPTGHSTDPRTGK